MQPYKDFNGDLRLAGDQLLAELERYFKHLDENPLIGNGVFDPETGQLIPPTVPRTGSVTGFCLFMHMKSSDFIVHRDHCPTEFEICIERLRKRLLEKAVAKDFAKKVAALPLLDLKCAPCDGVTNTCFVRDNSQ